MDLSQETDRRMDRNEREERNGRGPPKGEENRKGAPRRREQRSDPRHSQYVYQTVPSRALYFFGQCGLDRRAQGAQPGLHRSGLVPPPGPQERRIQYALSFVLPSQPEARRGKSFLPRPGVPGDPGEPASLPGLRRPDQEEDPFYQP